MPFGKDLSPDIVEVWNRPTVYFVTNAFRQRPVSRLLPRGRYLRREIVSPMPFGKDLSPDAAVNEADPAFAESPMPFGKDLSPDERAIEGYRGTHGKSPMPFGKDLSPDSKQNKIS